MFVPPWVNWYDARVLYVVVMVVLAVRLSRSSLRAEAVNLDKNLSISFYLQ